MINKGLIIAFDGKNSQIPRGWERVTEMDGLYIRGARTVAELSTICGSETHYHESDGHTHLTEHTHHTDYAEADGSMEAKSKGTTVDACEKRHLHPFSGEIPTAPGIGNTDDKKNYPPYYKVIFIRAKSNRAKIPKGGIVFREFQTIPIKNKPLKKVLHTKSQGRLLLGADKNGDAGEFSSLDNFLHGHKDNHTHTGSMKHEHHLTGEDSSGMGEPNITGTIDGVMNHEHENIHTGPCLDPDTKQEIDLHIEFSGPLVKGSKEEVTVTFEDNVGISVVSGQDVEDGDGLYPAYRTLYHYWAEKKNIKIEQGDILMCDKWALDTYTLEWYTKKGWLVCDGINFDEKTGIVTPILNSPNLDVNLANMGTVTDYLHDFSVSKDGGSNYHNHIGGENINHFHENLDPFSSLHIHKYAGDSWSGHNYGAAPSSPEDEDEGVVAATAGYGHANDHKRSGYTDNERFKFEETTIKTTKEADAGLKKASSVPKSFRVYFMYCTKKAARINQGGWIINRLIDG